jgi:uncharacterized protein (TIGR02217 family)
MSFHEVRFPSHLSFGSIGGPERRTEVVSLTNGFEERNTPWAHSRRRFDAGVSLRSLDDIAALIAFFEARRGQLYGFRWKDWSDFKSCTPSQSPQLQDQAIAVADGVQTVFQLTKTYGSAAHAYTRPIAKPVDGTVVIGVAGVEQTPDLDFVVATDTGEVTFTDPPMAGAPITAGYEFDVPVRFDTDAIRASMATFEAGEVPDVPVVEIRI